MADSRFFHNSGPFDLGQILVLTGAVAGAGADTAMLITDVASLDAASVSEISFLDNVKYLEQFRHSKAGACFVHPKHARHAPAGMVVLETTEPYRCYALTAQKFYPAVERYASVAASAYISSTASVEEDCVIGHNAVIGDKVRIGRGCHIGPGAVVHDGVAIGAGSTVGANSTLSHCVIGERVIIHRGVHIGQDGFGFALGAKGHVKVPQLGRVIIGDDVEIGSGTCIDRGAGPDTVIGEGTKIDNLVQIGHNVNIGKYSIIVSQVGIAGSTSIGSGVMIGGQAGVSGHLKIGDGARLAAKSGVMTDIPARAAFGGSPAVPVKDWHRQTLALAGMTKRKGVEND